ncbi:unnamed protein product [Rhizoctonia solani]|uniref:Uncharacterized protein n=1 Tax=Rhizoctonia solani TaxID=456999 RepID=A0A8H3GEJ8_9AGAM|nr:unnamed protein product [Rhizoctonia solani]
MPPDTNKRRKVKDKALARVSRSAPRFWSRSLAEDCQLAVLSPWQQYQRDIQDRVGLRQKGQRLGRSIAGGEGIQHCSSTSARKTPAPSNDDCSAPSDDDCSAPSDDDCPAPSEPSLHPPPAPVLDRSSPPLRSVRPLVSYASSPPPSPPAEHPTPSPSPVRHQPTSESRSSSPDLRPLAWFLGLPPPPVSFPVPVPIPVVPCTPSSLPGCFASLTPDRLTLPPSSVRPSGQASEDTSATVD